MKDVHRDAHGERTWMMSTFEADCLLGINYTYLQTGGLFCWSGTVIPDPVHAWAK